MQAKVLMIVTLTVNQEQEAEFTRFYQHEFLPAIIKEVTEFSSVRRYEVCGELRWNRRRTLSLYEIQSVEQAEAAFTGFSRPSLSDLVARFSTWKETDFSDFTRVLWQPIYEHRRVPADGAFGNRPLFTITSEIAPEHAEDFLGWMHETYLPRVMADVPALVACRQYASLATDPVRYLTCYECQDEASITRALGDMGAPHRYHENETMQRWEEKALTYRETCAYRQTYMLLSQDRFVQHDTNVN